MLATKTLVCIICGKHLIDASGDKTLGSVILRLDRHLQRKHPEKHAEYVTQRDLVMSLLPAYLLIDWFVHREKTKKLDPEVAGLLEKSQELIGEALNNNVEVIEETIEDKPTTEIVSKPDEVVTKT